jgi:hypothetical protein
VGFLNNGDRPFAVVPSLIETNCGQNGFHFSRANRPSDGAQ